VQGWICPTGVNWGRLEEFRCLIIAVAAGFVAEGVAVLNTVVVDIVVTVVMNTPHVLTANMPPRNIDSSNNVHVPGQLFRCQYLHLDKPVQIPVCLQLHILPWIPKNYHKNTKLILVCGMECCSSFSRTLKRGKRCTMHVIQDHESSHPC